MEHDLDPSDPRRDVRMDGVAFHRAAAGAGAAFRLPAGNVSYCVAIRAGEVTVETDFPSPASVSIRAGDLVAVSGLAPHAFRLADARGAEPSPLALQAMTATVSGDLDLVIGAAPSEFLALGSLMSGLIVVRPEEDPDLSRRLWRVIDMLEDEYSDDGQVDRDLVIRRLAEIMLVNMTRRVLRDQSDAAQDEVDPIDSRRIVQAINAYLAQPERSWKLPELARISGMSRTRFVETFKGVTGQTPAKLLSRMRLTSVARRLSMESMSVERAAEAAGYSSSAAFVRAFQRAFGETPARWRRGRGGDVDSRRTPVRAPRRRGAS